MDRRFNDFVDSLAKSQTPHKPKSPPTPPNNKRKRKAQPKNLSVSQDSDSDDYAEPDQDDEAEDDNVAAYAEEEPGDDGDGVADADEDDDENENVVDGEIEESDSGEDIQSDYKDEETDDEDDPKCAYTEAQEPYPREAYYDPGIDDIKAKCRAILAEIVAILNKHLCHTAAVEEFRIKARAYADVPETEPIVIALGGNSGMGKSSSTNSLNDIPELARWGNAGRAITTSIMEYRRPFPDQPMKYRCRIEYLASDNTTKLMKELVENYRLFFFEMTAKTPKKLKQQYQARAKVALDTLSCLFRHREGFSTVRAAKSYLLANKQVQSKTLASTMASWCSDLLRLRAVGLEDGKLVEYHDATSAQRLRKKIDVLLSASNKNNEPTLWPLVRIVSIGISGCHLLEHISLGDTPGISDVNQVRMAVSLEYIMGSQMLWLVTEMKRVCTDLTVRGLLQRYGERFENKLLLIATGSDDVLMSTVTVDELEEQGYKMNLYKKLTKEAAAQEKDISKKMKRLQNLQGRSDAGAATLERELGIDRTKQNQTETQRFGLLVKARNGSVAAGVRKEMRSYLPKGTELPFFPVANRHYATIKGALTLPPPILDAQGTGIPDLRAYALSLAAPGLMQTLQSYIHTRFHVFITGVDLWANRRYIKTADELRRIVDKPKIAFMITIEEYLKQISCEAVEKISEPLEAKHAEYALKAQKTVNSWNKWHWCSIKAFINNNGAHETTVVGTANWNEQFMRPAVKGIIRPNWKSIEQISKSLFADLTTALKEMLETIVEELKQEYDAQGLPLGKFYDTVRDQITGMQASVAKHTEAYLQDLANIKLSATTDLPGGLFTETLSKCYDDCQHDGGSGYKARVLGRFRTTLTAQGPASPFVILGKSIATAVHRNAQKCAKGVTEDFVRTLDVIRETFDLMIADQLPDPSEEGLRWELMHYLNTKKADLRNIKEALQVIEEKPEYQRGGTGAGRKL
ncbi:hypothetical protein LTR10_000799 [Elasticomyces elasticus]|nr:hypothetical protein LTR10_000799 [Elasticomyces elasticus]KAK4979954.1 hypothetical protein LTR42_000261 [Elasticomyces elasticus]